MEPCGFPAGSYSPMVPRFALWSCFPMVLCGRIHVPMVLVRQDARPDGALLCAVELLPDGALRLPWRQLLPDGAVRLSCWQLLPDGALLCTVELLPDGALRRPWR